MHDFLYVLFVAVLYLDVSLHQLLYLLVLLGERALQVVDFTLFLI